MGKKVLLLGFGMQGKAALFDLINCNIVSHILVVDNQPDLQNQLLQYPVERVSGKSLDVNDKSNMFSLMSEIDLVVEALPGPFALPMGQLAAECGVNLVSSMYYHDPGETDNAKIQLTKNSLNKIDKQAKAKNIIILSEFGLDPGLDIILGVKAKNEMEILEELYMYGAGIPASNARTNPLKYKFSWNIMGVIDAYHRPASFITKGQSVEIEASRIFESDNCHLINVKEIGSPLESFVNGNSVYFAELLGIRDSIQEMKRYTCRLPGHCTFWCFDPQ
jgi:lysine 6-dehydrogenase